MGPGSGVVLRVSRLGGDQTKGGQEVRKCKRGNRGGLQGFYDWHYQRKVACVCSGLDSIKVAGRASRLLVSHKQIYTHTNMQHKQEHILSSPTLPKLTLKKGGLDGFGSVTITQGQEREKSVQQL